MRTSKIRLEHPHQELSEDFERLSDADRVRSEIIPLLDICHADSISLGNPDECVSSSYGVSHQLTAALGWIDRETLIYSDV